MCLIVRTITLPLAGTCATQVHYSGGAYEVGVFEMIKSFCKGIISLLIDFRNQLMNCNNPYLKERQKVGDLLGYSICSKDVEKYSIDSVLEVYLSTDVLRLIR